LFEIGVLTPIWEYFSPDDIFISVDVSNDGSYIIAGTKSIYNKSKIILFSTTQNTPLWIYEVGDAIASVAISANGEYVVAGCEDNNVYFGSRDRFSLWIYKTNGYVWSVSISENGKYVAAASLDGKVYFLDGATGSLLWSYQAGVPSTQGSALGVWTIDMSSDGKYVVAGTAEPYGDVYLFDGTTGKVLWIEHLPEAIRTVSISRDCSTVVAGTVAVNMISGVIAVYSTPTPSTTTSLPTPKPTPTLPEISDPRFVELIRYVRDKVRLYSEQFDPNFYSVKSEEYRRIVYEKSRELLKVDATSIVKSIAMDLASKYLPPLTYYSYAEKLLKSFEVVGYMLLDLMYQSLYQVFSALNYWNTAGSISGKLGELADMLDSVVKAVEDRDVARYEVLKEQLKGEIEDTVHTVQEGEIVLYQWLGWEPTGILYSYNYRMSILKASRMISDLLVTLDTLYTLLYNDSLSKFYSLDKGEGPYTPTDIPYVANFTWCVNGVKSYTARGGDSVKLVVDVSAKPFRRFQCSKIRVVVYKDISSWFDTPIKDTIFDLEDRLYQSTSLSVEFNAEDSFLLRGYKFKAYAYGCSYPLPYKEGENKWIPLVVAPQMEFSPSGEGSEGFTRITTYPPGLRIESTRANSGVLVYSSESGHRLHIRLVDDLGRIVGYYQGSIRRDVDGSDYIVLENGVVAIAPLGNYKIVIDTSEMSEEKVTYNLTINIISNEEKIKEETHENISIEKGEKHEYTIIQPQTPTTTTTTTTPEKEATSLPLILVVVPMLIVAAMAVILLLKRK